VVLLVGWALVMAGEIGYVIGRDRSAGQTVLRPKIDSVELTVLQAMIQSQQQRLDGAAAALPSPQAPPALQISLDSFDPLGGARLVTYSGTLVLAGCTGFADPATCPAQRQLTLGIARAPDGTYSLTSPLSAAQAITRSGDAFHAHGPVSNADYAAPCNGEAMATSFDLALAPSQLTVTNGAPAVAVFSATVTMTAAPDGVCPQSRQSVYQGSVVAG